MHSAKKLELEIINSLIMMPGIKGFITSNYRAKTSKLLAEDSWTDSMTIDENALGIVIEISIAISFDAKAYDLCNRINGAIKAILKKSNEKKLASLNIYIRKVVQ